VQILRLQSVVLARENFAEAAGAFTTELASALQCERVSLGFLERGYAKVVAISHSADFDSRQSLFNLLGAAMDESIDQAAILTLPEIAADRPHITVAHTELRKCNGTNVCTLPLVIHTRIAGALTLERAADKPFTRSEIALYEHIAALVGPLLELKRALERPLLERFVSGAREFAQRLVRPGHPRVKLAVFGGLALLLAVALIPVPYRVSAPARLEAATQRVLTAPADGFLQAVHSRPGDAVKAGQVLVELAEQELQIDRRRWQAELAQHDNAYGSALARSDRAQLVMSNAKAAEARAQLALVDQQLARTKVLAPFDGIVIKGDLTQSLGAPLQRGETLLTLAPSSEYRLIIEVDERDIGQVVKGQRGQLALTALPASRIAFRVIRITPVAATVEGRHFFEIEAALSAPAAVLRPGLQGVAKIQVDHRTSLWIVSHRLLEWLRLKLWAMGA
jgi:RND family efflux transporter MFP subunit